MLIRATVTDLRDRHLEVAFPNLQLDRFGQVGGGLLARPALRIGPEDRAMGRPTWPLTEDLTGQHGGTLPLCIRQDALCVAVVDQVIDGNDELAALARMRPHRVVSTADTGRRPSKRFQPLFELRPL